ncbi:MULTISPECIES: S41 family peptidase [unclassified Azospirillum]|uniref:S41 family peptidase n=1 Tax=unclassified Azospirillum TaxID=2630922 RepID=UPI000B648CED|nr:MULTISPECIES: S41 family peptidase [unclassified Azospirillum]SNS55765.1 carboxyl-terminal processing protease [Azospirillum sp. RU38E]SNS75393.1 carboxyl-terminal processing protease [Azospirillum sp. RU37A]
MVRRRLAPVLLLFSLIGGCAANHAELQQPGQAGSVTAEQLFTVAFRPIADNWLKPVAMPQLVTDGLRRVATADGALWVVQHDGQFLLLRDGKEQARLPQPSDTIPERWAALTSEMLRAMRTASPTLAARPAEAVYRDMFDGMMADLDQYSRYAEPNKAQKERSQREGYDGIGISIRDVEGGGFEVSDVVPDGPADQAGIKVGDRILTVAGLRTVSMGYDTLSSMIQGPEGSSVELRVGPDDAQARTLTVRRRHLVPNMVKASLADGVLVLKIERFNNATQEHVRQAVLRAQEKSGPLKGVVMDLRGNPGGVMVQAVGVVNLFVPQGRIITTRGRHPNSVQWFEAQKPMTAFPDLPLVVLIDGNTASSAEIVAAALQDAGRALLVGSSSFGKGSVQHVTQLPNGGELFITWSRIYAPSGYSFDGQGIQPNLCLSRSGVTMESLLGEAGRVDRGAQTQLVRLRMAATEDESMRASLRQECPPASATGPESALGMAVARNLLRDGAFYRQALASRQTNVAER